MNDVVLMAGFAAVLVWAVVVGLIVIGLALAFVRTVIEQIGRLTAKHAKEPRKGLTCSKVRKVFFQGLEKREGGA